METKIYGEYVAPEINVVELKSQGVLCESQKLGIGDGEGYERQPW